MPRYAVLIDAGFLKRKLGSQENPTSAHRAQRFVDRLKEHEALRSASLHRIYYYDAPPLEGSRRRPLKGGTENFGQAKLAKRNKALLAQLAQAPFFALRLGEIKFRGWKVPDKSLPAFESSVTLTSDDLRPNIQQKGVDMRIGLDIASLTLKRHAEIIVLVTADADFIPPMKFARREGAQLYLVTLGHSTSEKLIEHADLVLEIDVDNLIEADEDDGGKRGQTR